MTALRIAAERFAAEGYVALPDLLDADACEATDQALAGLICAGAGSRELLAIPACRALAIRLRQTPQIAPLLGAHATAVQCTLFEKTAHSNWLVPLHQDRSVPVASRIEHAGLSGWSQKQGRLYVQPPVEVLEQLTVVRLHLDPCPEASGALRVVPGSHGRGVLSAQDARQLRAAHGERSLAMPRGAALVLKPLLLHASSKAREASRRRVLHFVFGPSELPYGLKWPEPV